MEDATTNQSMDTATKGPKPRRVLIVFIFSFSLDFSFCFFFVKPHLVIGYVLSSVLLIKEFSFWFSDILIKYN